MDNKERCEHNFPEDVCPECGDGAWDEEAYELRRDGLRIPDEEKLLTRIFELERRVERLQEQIWNLKGRPNPRNVNPYDLSRHGGRARQKPKQ